MPITNVAVVSDIHVGSTVALSPEKFVLPDGNMHVASKMQDYIRGRWEEYWGEVFKNPTVVVINGDIIEGNNGRKSLEIWAPRVKDQADAAIELLKPIAQKARAVYVVRGTPFHVLEGGPVEDYISQEIGAWSKKAIKRLRLKVDGVTIEFVHKGKKFGSYEWTWENGLRQHCKSVLVRHLMAGMEHPDILVYSHYHRFVDSGDIRMGTMDGVQHSIRGIITPSWKLIDEWTNHTDSPVSDLGLVSFSIEEGGYYVHPMVDHIDPAEEVEYVEVDQ